MTLQQLRYVVTIAEIGTISKAAEELFVSQPSLTKALKETGKRDADHDLRPHEQGNSCIQRRRDLPWICKTGIGAGGIDRREI